MRGLGACASFWLVPKIELAESEIRSLYFVSGRRNRATANESALIDVKDVYKEDVGGIQGDVEGIESRIGIEREMTRQGEVGSWMPKSWERCGHSGDWSAGRTRQNRNLN